MNARDTIVEFIISELRKAAEGYYADCPIAIAVVMNGLDAENPDHRCDGVLSAGPPGDDGDMRNIAGLISFATLGDTLLDSGFTIEELQEGLNWRRERTPVGNGKQMKSSVKVAVCERSGLNDPED